MYQYMMNPFTSGIKVMLWCMQVENRDVMEAFRLLEVAMQQSATDHTTGSFPTVLVPSFLPDIPSTLTNLLTPFLDF